MSEANEMLSGYGTRASGQSPVANGALHVILLAAGSMFLLPLIWMASTSLKPSDQTMSLPPTWIPRATMATLNGQRVVVVRDGRPLKEESVIVVARNGHEPGVRKLLPAMTNDKPTIIDGKTSVLRYVESGREMLEPSPVDVDIVKKCPAGYWRVTKWVPEFDEEREKSNSSLEWDCVPADDLSAVPHAFFSNYAASIRRMQDKEPDAKWYSSGFFRYLFNTLWVCVMSVIGSIVSCTLVAYSFVFLEFKGRNVLFAITLAVMMIPFPAIMVPLFDVFRSLGWIGTYKPLWVPAWCGGAFFIFLLRQFFLGLPKDLLDAARIDGCTELEILWHVVVPLARPALAMVALFQFLGSWKDFMGPMLYLTDPKQFTLSLGLQALFSQHGNTPWHIIMAASMMFSLPLIVLFLSARKTFMRGIAMTGLKG